MQNLRVDAEKAILVGLGTPGAEEEARDSMAELARLAESAGAEVMGSEIQFRKRPDPATWFGSGKVDEIAAQAREKGCTLVVTDDELKPSQQRNLEEAL